MARARASDSAVLLFKLLHHRSRIFQLLARSLSRTTGRDPTRPRSETHVETRDRRPRNKKLSETPLTTPLN